MRLTITFSRPDGREAVKGPFERVRLEGEVMRSQPDRETVASHEHHAWRVDAERFTRADCSCPCTLHFIRADAAASKSFGPFESISFVDGIAYADRAVFAFVDRSVGDWYCHADERHYPVLVIEPVR